MAKTVRVRVAVAVNGDGDWYAAGQKGQDDFTISGDCASSLIGPVTGVFWLEADLPIPEAKTIEAEVKDG